MGPPDSLKALETTGSSWLLDDWTTLSRIPDGNEYYTRRQYSIHKQPVIQQQTQEQVEATAQEEKGVGHAPDEVAHENAQRHRQLVIRTITPK
jgi:hypothetical protein